MELFGDIILSIILIFVFFWFVEWVTYRVHCYRHDKDYSWSEFKKFIHEDHRFGR